MRVRLHGRNQNRLPSLHEYSAPASRLRLLEPKTLAPELRVMLTFA
jgi:hypothetical protein